MAFCFWFLGMSGAAGVARKRNEQEIQQLNGRRIWQFVQDLGRMVPPNTVTFEQNAAIMNGMTLRRCTQTSFRTDDWIRDPLRRDIDYAVFMNPYAEYYLCFERSARDPDQLQVYKLDFARGSTAEGVATVVPKAKLNIHHGLDHNGRWFMNLRKRPFYLQGGIVAQMDGTSAPVVACLVAHQQGNMHDQNLDMIRVTEATARKTIQNLC